MTLDILISTYNERVYNIQNILLPQHPNISYIIAHQVVNETDYSKIKFELEKRKDVRYFISHSRGLSKNRNLCLKHIKSNLIYICDDDVKLLEKNIFQAIKVFENNIHIDMARFQIVKTKNKLYKKYKEHSYKIKSLFQLTDFSSIEMMLRSSILLKGDISFDEDFGINGKYSIGEDFIFAFDVFSSGANIEHYPLSIVEHVDDGSGANIDDNTIYSRGAVFARVFGRKSLMFDFLFCLKNYKKYCHLYTFNKYLKLMLLGSKNYLASQNQITEKKVPINDE